MRRAQHTRPPRRQALIAAAVGVLGLAVVALCFAAYLTPAAQWFLLASSAFCE
jgi:hypothetical protein